MTVKITRVVKPKDFVKFVEFHGYRFERQNGTSHAIYKKPGTYMFLNIPMHSTPLTPGVIKSNLRNMGLIMADLYDYLHDIEAKQEELYNKS